MLAREPQWEWTRDLHATMRNAKVWDGGNGWIVDDVQDVVFTDLEEDAEAGVVLLTQLGCDMPIPFNVFAEMCQSFLGWWYEKENRGTSGSA